MDHPPLPFGVVLPAALIVSAIAGALFGSPLVAAARSWIAGEPVPLETIAVRGSERLTASEVAESTGLSPQAALDSFDPREIEQRLTAHPWIAEATALRLPTGRLLLRVTERVPRAVVAIGGDGEEFAVDASGMAFAPAEERDLSTLPRLTASGDIEMNTPDARLAGAVALVDRFSAFDLPTPTELIIAAETDPEGFAMRLPDLKPRIVLGREEFDLRLARLVRLLQANPAELASSETVDLRFADQAVLRGASPSQGATKAAAARGRAASSKAGPAG